MRLFTKFSLFLVIVLFVMSATNVAFGQIKYPRASQRQHIEQTVGDTDIKITYHRPNVKEREIWGKLVPYGQVWRAGANEATVIEFTNDVSIDGNELEKGKYSFYAIPTAGEWTLIFNKTWNQWGTQYKESEDALRVNVKPMMAEKSKETLSYSIEDVTNNSANVILAWEKARVPFKVDVGDVSARILRSAQRQMVATPLNAANFIFSTRQKDKYDQALSWVNGSLATAETYFGLFIKSRLLAEMDKKDEAITTAEKAIEVGKKTNANPNSIAFLERLMKSWKTEE